MASSASSVSEYPRTLSETKKNDKKSYLFTKIKSIFIISLSLGSYYNVRETFGFFKTALTITSITTALGFVFFGLYLGADFSQRSGSLNAFRKNAFSGAAIGFIGSSVILLACEGYFLMYQEIKNYF